MTGDNAKTDNTAIAKTASITMVDAFVNNRKPPKGIASKPKTTKTIKGVINLTDKNFLASGNFSST